MRLRSSAPTIGAMLGNDYLDRAEQLVAELRIPPRWRDDARQEAALAMIEGADPVQAIRRFVRQERAGGLTGGHTDRPDVKSLNDPSLRYEQTSDAEVVLLRREEDARRAEIAGAVLNRMTERERTIVRLQAQGWTQEEIASHLGVSRQRVGQMLANIQSKNAQLHCNN